MKTDTETLIADLRKLDQQVNRNKLCKCLTMQEAADRLERLHRLYDYLEQPGVLMSIPQPHRLEISRLLHEDER
jgi:hypothetical protein